MTVDRSVLILKMMAHPIRLKILKILSDKKDAGICVGGIEDIINVAQSSVSQHLAHLRNSGILKCRKDGKKVCYKILDENVIKILSQIEIEDI